MLVEALISEPPVEARDEAVLLGLARVDEVQPHAAFVGPLVERLVRQLGPLSRTMTSGIASRSSVRRSSTRTTLTPGSEVSTSMASDSLVEGVFRATLSVG